MKLDETLQLAVQHHQAGRLAEAEKYYQQILAVDPAHPDALHLLGVALAQSGRRDIAIDLINKAIAVRPAAREFHSNLGNALRESGRLEEAAQAYRRAIEIKPDSFDDYLHLGQTLSQLGQLDAAIDAYRQAIRLKPDSPMALNLFRSALETAIAQSRIDVQSSPENIEAHYRLGRLLRDIGDISAALAAFETALRIDPNRADIACEIGIALDLKGDYAQAIAAHLRALRIDPNFADTHFNLGHTYSQLGRFDESIASYAEAARLKPDWPDAHWNLSLALLRRGDFVRGWKEYEWRWRLPTSPSLTHNVMQPMWNGESLSGKTILLRPEQGFGDTIQFIRYAPLVAARGGRVLLTRQPELSRLLECAQEVEQVASGPQMQFDVYCPLMRLPLLFGTTLQSLPANVPYLRPDRELVAAWGKKLGQRRGQLRVGVAWAGLPAHQNDRNRSMSLAMLAPLSDVQGVDFYSLQKGPASSQTKSPPSGMRLIDLTAEIQDFADTAALMSHLDLVIAIDTSVVHLAGAMGISVWTMLPFRPDWRWMTDRDDSPWYPTMRLFRQKRAGDWADVVARVKEALTQRRASQSGTSAPPAFSEQMRLGNELLSQRKLDDAISVFREALKSNPDNPDILNNLGVVLGEKGLMEEAVATYRKALELRPAFPVAANNLGSALASLGKLDEAIAVYERGLALDPTYAKLHYNLGMALIRQGKNEQAAAAHQNAVRCDPKLTAAIHALGYALAALKQYDAAIDCYRKALAQQPDFIEAYINLGNALVGKEQIDDAIAAYRNALRLDPKNPNIHFNLGYTLGARDPDAAIASYREALRLRPDFHNASNNLGNLLEEAGRFDEAIAVYEQALKFHPQSGETHWNLSLALLITGQFARGWRECEWRWKWKDLPVPGRNLPQPKWDGSDLPGKTLLLHAEQGFGDTIQFIRYLPMVASRVGRMVISAQPALARLLGKNFDVEQVPYSGPFKDFDVHCPMMTLPLIFDTRLETIPASVPYLAADPQLISKWSQKLRGGTESDPRNLVVTRPSRPCENPDDFNDPGKNEIHRIGASRTGGTPVSRLHVGLVWAGSGSHPNDRNRSMKFSDLLPLSKVPGVRYYNLQIGPAAAQSADATSVMDWTDYTADLADFAETAAMIWHLDLVITVDTAVAHLAGAMGKPVWILLSRKPDWRWLLEREDSPWYPTMRLFRQKNRGDWKELVERVVSALSSHAAGHDKGGQSKK